MLQLEMKTYASDAIEDAQRLAQTKALNSYSFSDLFNFLNYTWMDMYQQIALVDEGFYSKTMRLTHKLTKLPPCVKHTIKVYAAQVGNQYNREIFRESGYNDLQGWNTFHLSGFDLYCPDAERRHVFVNFLPAQPQLFFTRDNRDPKLYEDPNNMPTKFVSQSQNYNLWQINVAPAPITDGFNYLVKWSTGGAALDMGIKFHYRNSAANLADVDVSAIFERACKIVKHVNGVTTTIQEPQWAIVSFIADYPYVFVTYQHLITGEYLSGFYHALPECNEFIEYNPFAFTGRNSNVEYLQCKWNDKTGLGVIIKDYNDIDQDTMQPKIKELGWTPDTLLTYPTPEMYRLLVARLADKFAALNESQIMGIQKELTDAEWAFKNFLGINKASWKRIDNVNGPNIGDWL